MKKYFISLDDKQEGPFTIEELKSKNLTNKYLVWSDGFAEWKRISIINELKDFVVRLPPNVNDKKTINIAKEKYSRIALIIGSLIALILYYYLGGFDNKNDLIENYYGNKYDSDKYLYDYTILEKVENQTRLIIGAISIVIGLITGLMIYFLAMMNTYKSLYKNN